MTPVTNHHCLRRPKHFRIKLLEEQASLLRNSVICAFQSIVGLEGI